MWESYKTGIMRNPGLVSPPLWLENYNPAYVKQMQISPCLFSITIFAQMLSLFYWLTCWKNRFVKFYVGSCCDLRQHECKPHNRGLNNKCYDDCMCEEGEGFFLYCSITGCNSFKHFTFCNHFFKCIVSVPGFRCYAKFHRKRRVTRRKGRCVVPESVNVDQGGFITIWWRRREEWNHHPSEKSWESHITADGPSMKMWSFFSFDNAVKAWKSLC